MRRRKNEGVKTVMVTKVAPDVSKGENTGNTCSYVLIVLLTMVIVLLSLNHLRGMLPKHFPPRNSGRRWEEVVKEKKERMRKQLSLHKKSLKEAKERRRLRDVQEITLSCWMKQNGAQFHKKMAVEEVLVSGKASISKGLYAGEKIEV